jgi:hypothetical protein
VGHENQYSHDCRQKQEQLALPILLPVSLRDLRPPAFLLSRNSPSLLFRRHGVEHHCVAANVAAAVVLFARSIAPQNIAPKIAPMMVMNNTDCEADPDTHC